MPLSKNEKREMCAGCKDNFYNGGNPYGVKECWNLTSATVVSRVQVHIDQVPPWTQEPVNVLSCYKQNHYVFVDPNCHECRKENYTNA